MGHLTAKTLNQAVFCLVRSNPNAGTGKAGLSRTARREKPTLLSRKVPEAKQKADSEPSREERYLLTQNVALRDRSRVLLPGVQVAGRSTDCRAVR